MERSTPARLVEQAAEAVEGAVEQVAERLAGAAAPREPGAPGSRPATLEEPTEAREPLPPKAEQGAPALATATGAPVEGAPNARAQQGGYLTTATGTRLVDTDHSLKAGSRGPTLLADHHLREKITHFDHERIPERVVHARGAGAHGTFVANGAGTAVCRAAFLAEGVQTPVFVRFSTVLGSRGSADTVRDTRGFATKFYTSEGNFDLVGNNIPVFFIQDGIKFPDVIHAGKPHPDREIPQAQSAHDTFWDFVSLHTEAQHHTIWNMSDRAVPRSYRMMEGFGVHTFRLVDAEGATVLVKFHWKPVLGVHSLTWEEAQLAAGVDPDFHRRDLYDAIESGAHPQWELGIQVFPDTPEQTFEGIDLLDPTKIVPEELAPVQVLGRMTLDRTPTNFFAEVEQVAFHVGHLVPGIDLTDDPLLHARLFSYLDTQITRLGGPNFDQIPVNRPHCPVNDMLRDGYHQHAVHAGVAPYKPNSLDGGLPVAAAEDEGGYAERAVVIPPASTRVRQSPATFDDHFSQARLFWLSMTPVEQEHIIRAYTFELGKCYEQAIRERQLLALARIDARLCREVAAGLGLPAPAADAGDAARAGDPAAGAIPGDADAGQLPVDPVSGAVAVALDEQPSPALSQLGGTWPVEGRIVGVVVDRAAVGFDVRAVADAIRGAGMRPLVVAATGGPLADGTPVQRTFLTARSVEFDALLLAGAPVPAADAIALRDARAAAPATPGLDPRVQLLLDECVRHAKAVAGIGDGRAALEASLGAGVPGVILGEDPADVVASLSELMAAHRVWERFPVEVPLVAPSPAPPGT